MSFTLLALTAVAGLTALLHTAGTGGGQAAAKSGDRPSDNPAPVRSMSRPASANADGTPPSGAPLTVENALQRARPFAFGGPSGQRQQAAECLAAAVWYESGDDRVGQRAVAQTVINRLNHPAFPNSVCGVVFQGSERRTGCQFTFTCDGSLGRRRPSAKAWERALQVANEALDGYVDSSIGTATHYHADYVSPWWSSKLVRLSVVGPHIFYRWAGAANMLHAPTRLDPEANYDRLVERSIAAAAESRADGPAREPGLSAGLESGLLRSSLAPIAESAPPPAAGTRSAIFLQVGEARSSGRWAVAAMRACGDRSTCQVFGYADPVALSDNRARPASRLAKPAFLFLRDARSGMDLALWDCETVERPSANQCLPAEGAALRSLLAERQ